jgi:hypothetical protein
MPQIQPKGTIEATVDKTTVTVANPFLDGDKLEEFLRELFNKLAAGGATRVSVHYNPNGVI